MAEGVKLDLGAARCELDGAPEAEPIAAPGGSPRVVDGMFTEELEDRVVTGRVFNIQRFSTEDGPGIRTTVFLKGCPLICPWCANPESQLAIAEVAHSDSLCDHCGRCLEACEKKAVVLNPEGGVIIDRKVCDDCAKCVSVCGPRALRVIGTDYTVEQIFEEIRRDEAYYRNSGGGVTCSGGEPLTQARFVAALFKRCQDAGYHTTLDTCGSAPRRTLERVLDYTDLVLFDLKIYDRAAHTAVAGRSNQQIFENAKYVASRGVRMIARMPLIPGYTDSDENVSAVAGFVRKLGGHVPVNVLPYHRFGMNKYRMLDRAYEPGELKPPPPERVQKIVDRFQSLGLECEIIT